MAEEGEGGGVRAGAGAGVGAGGRRQGAGGGGRELVAGRRPSKETRGARYGQIVPLRFSEFCHVLVIARPGVAGTVLQTELLQ